MANQAINECSPTFTPSNEPWGLGLRPQEKDPWGFWIAWNLDHNLSSFRRQGEKDAKGRLIPYFKSVTTYILTTPDLFTDANIKAGRDLSAFKDQTLIKNWMAVTHGVHGKPIGLHVDSVVKELRRQRVVTRPWTEEGWLEFLHQQLVRFTGGAL